VKTTVTKQISGWILALPGWRKASPKYQALAPRNMRERNLASVLQELRHIVDHAGDTSTACGHRGLLLPRQRRLHGCSLTYLSIKQEPRRINETTKSRSATSLFKTSFCMVQSRLSKEHITPDHQDLVAIFHLSKTRTERAVSSYELEA
jgi:hypothetical protein